MQPLEIIYFIIVFILIIIIGIVIGIKGIDTTDMGYIYMCLFLALIWPVLLGLIIISSPFFIPYFTTKIIKNNIEKKKCERELLEYNYKKYIKEQINEN
jgi:hypothetical protein